MAIMTNQNAGQVRTLRRATTAAHRALVTQIRGVKLKGLTGAARKAAIVQKRTLRRQFRAAASTRRTAAGLPLSPAPRRGTQKAAVPAASGATQFGHANGNVASPFMANGQPVTRYQHFRTKARYQEYLDRGGAPLGELTTRSSGQTYGRIPASAPQAKNFGNQKARQTQMNAWLAGRSAALKRR